MRGAFALIALGAALAVCAPWSARNCLQMSRCALVSYNGGWNLLIGADEAATGTWAEIKVPPECREVWGEAEKDVCFGDAARRWIAEHPAEWLALAPRKLAATFDYAGAGPWYLHAANPTAFPERAKVAVGAIETVFERVVLIGALLAGARGAVARLRGRRRPARTVLAIVALCLALAGVVGAVTLHAFIGYLLLAPVLLLGFSAAGSQASDAEASDTKAPDTKAPDTKASDAKASDVEGTSRPVLPAATAAVLLSLAATHAIFFGAGRYSLVAFPFVTAAAALVLASERSQASPGVRRGF